MSNDASALGSAAVPERLPEGASPPAQQAADDLVAQLTAEQGAALRHLIGGMSIREAAEAAGIGRRTLYRWLKEDDTFAALFNLWKREQIESARAQALALASSAMKTIGNAIEKGHVPAALQVAKGLGVLTPPPRGETDPDLLGRKRTVAKARRRMRLQRDERTYDVDKNRLQTVADCDRIIHELQQLRFIMIKNNFDSWSHYDRTKDLTADECFRRNCVKASGPPDCPRPSESELWETVRWNELPENYYGLQLRQAVESYLAALNGSARETAAPPEQTPPDPAPASVTAAASPATPVADNIPRPAPPAAMKAAPGPAPAAVTRRPRKAPNALTADDDEWPWVRIS